jgi:hypothetical protein
MKYIINLLLFLILCSSCTKKENLGPVLKNTILDYQKLFPLAEESDSIFPFYIVNVRKVKNDTLLTISRGRVSNKKHYNHYQIFEDEQLKPTVIFDFVSLGKKFIEYYPERKGNELLKTPPIEKNNPNYIYELKNNEIFFLKEENY